MNHWIQNEWNVFNSKRLYLIHLNINSPPPKIDELRHIANASNAAVIGITSMIYFVETETVPAEVKLIISEVK